ncbi:hypothetical protein A2Z00_03595 [Candidatus Gottesmanbacteria bacterium RBG_13_45_10]|uniref:Uncharacterized protein n=1 Tax=Candidatus Gottesmanbacteria bacterium RBG_13_45_10 TaxID=1798370 RepID=A0A1F5ZGH8_9BACT|nr:MAG: hypothetical protein A2Z00_03595 [Candidatus Gottesmanbacteria bacterium RBG_13_45_10]
MADRVEQTRVTRFSREHRNKARLQQIFEDLVATVYQEDESEVRRNSRTVRTPAGDIHQSFFARRAFPVPEVGIETVNFRGSFEYAIATEAEDIPEYGGWVLEAYSKYKVVETRRHRGRYFPSACLGEPAEELFVTYDQAILQALANQTRYSIVHHHFLWGFPTRATLEAAGYRPRPSEPTRLMDKVFQPQQNIPVIGALQQDN